MSAPAMRLGVRVAFHETFPRNGRRRLSLPCGYWLAISSAHAPARTEWALGYSNILLVTMQKRRGTRASAIGGVTLTARRSLPVFLLRLLPAGAVAGLHPLESAAFHGARQQRTSGRA